MIALLCAVYAETRCAAKFLSGAHRTAIDNLFIWRGDYAGKPALVAQMGMGPRAAKIAAHTILSAYPVTRLVSFGFAGGLDPDLVVGELVVNRRLTMPDEADLYADATLSEQAVALAVHAGLSVRTAAGVTIDHVAVDPAEKRSLAARHQAETVDMESYSLARVATVYDLPFLALRVISDAANDHLPALDGWGMPGGWRQAVKDLAAQPGQVATLLRLARNVRRAQHSLCGFFRAGREETALWI